MGFRRCRGIIEAWDCHSQNTALIKHMLDAFAGIDTGSKFSRHVVTLTFEFGFNLFKYFWEELVPL